MIDDEQYYDIPFEDYDVPYVTLEQMHELSPNTKLNKDEQTGLYYTDYFHIYATPNLLCAHYLVELLMEDPKKVDWAKVTHGYSKYDIEYIEHIYTHPLVWVDKLPDKLQKEIVVVGKIAQEKSSYERSCCSPYENFFFNMFYDRVLWFADNMPTGKDYGYFSIYHSDFILWNYLTEERSYYDPHEDEEKPIFFKVDIFLRNINYIAEHRGGAKAAELVRLFRQDWPSIVALKLFCIEYMSEQQIEAFRLALFEGMERNLCKWEAEQPKQPKPKKEQRPTPKSITFKMGNITDGHLQMLRLKLIDAGWIARDTQPDDFTKLFTGKLNSTQITWTGNVGKGMLVFLFSKMAEQGYIVVPTNHSITTILENHFIDADGNNLSGLNSSKESTKHLPIVKECLDILQLEADAD